MYEKCNAKVEVRKSEPRDIKWNNPKGTEIVSLQYGKDSKGHKWKKTVSATNEMLFVEKDGQWCICVNFDEEPSQNDVWCKLSRQNRKGV